MSAWFKKKEFKLKGLKGTGSEDGVKVPKGLWVKCDHCGEIIYKKEVVANLHVCPKCSYHFRISAMERINLIFDEGSFEEYDANLKATDPLVFKDLKSYKDRLKSAWKSKVAKDAMISGLGTIDGQRTSIAVFEFSFMGGSMGSVVGEKITRAMERGLEYGCPVIVVSSSGGARMHEGVLSLMQMAKTSQAIRKLREAGVPYISILTDPTTGGVTASFAMLGDINIAEPRALIGFAGPRVIEQTIRQKLPEGFQRAEYLLEHGMIDMIVERKDLKNKLSTVIRLLTSQNKIA